MNLLWDASFPLKLYAQKKENQASPLSVGQKMPDFNIANEELISKLPLSGLNKTNIKKLANNKPLVISFLSDGWNNYALVHLQKLIDSYQEIIALGGELLVVVQGQVNEVKEFVNHFQIPFHVIAAPTHEIATLFGVYDEEFPLWESIAGISQNVSIPAVYTIGRNGKIVYAAVDKQFDKPFAITEMLASVYGANNNIPVVIRQEMAA